jgi:hypothetical protein
MIMAGLKRHAGAAACSNELKEEMKLLKTDTPVITLKVPKTEMGKRHIKSASDQHNSANGNLSLRDITDLLCPNFSYKRIGYGNRWDQRSWQAITYNLKSGLSSHAQWLPGRQYWAEYAVMPIYDPGVAGGTVAASTFQQDGFTGNIFDLISKAEDVRNEKGALTIARPYNATTFSNPGNSPISDSINRETIKSMYQLAFEYQGGYQEHTWTNINSSEITIFVVECQPRTVMSCIKSLGLIDSSGTVRERFDTITVGQSVLEDYKANLPIGNNYEPTFTASAGGVNNSSTDELSDPHVKIGTRSNRTHFVWKCSKEIRVKLQPGERYTHKVAIDPFSFNESSWNKLLNTNKGHAMTSQLSTGFDWSTMPMFLPAVSKMLVVRAISEIGWADNNTSVTAVGLLPGALTHTCTEYHKCRTLPFNFQDNHFMEYHLGSTASKTINRLTAEAEFIEASGIAEDPTMVEENA